MSNSALDEDQVRVCFSDGVLRALERKKIGGGPEDCSLSMFLAARGRGDCGGNISR